MRRSPVPGEAPLLSRVRTMAVVQNVTLGTLTDEIHLDAAGPVLTAWALDPDVGEASPHLVTAFPLL